MKIPLTIFVLATVMAVHAGGVELKKTPVQSMLKSGVQLAAASDDDDFDVWSKPEGSSRDVTTANEKKDQGGKSLFKAGLYSALIPGMGEYYVGHKTKAKFFFAVEAASWIGFVSYRVYSGWKKDDMVKFASDNANVSLDGKDDWFEDMVGFYDNIDQYNTRGRVDDPERPYLVDNSDNHWSWIASRDQATYRHLKNRYREANRRSEFMIGLMIVNRIVSIIDAVRDARRYEAKVDESFTDAGGVQLHFDVDPFDDYKPVSLTLVKRF